MGYIYKITNLVNQKSYIGLTTLTPKKRWEQHLQSANNPNSSSYNELFKKAIRKYGKENFLIETIDEAESLEELKQKEQYWIEYFNTYAFKENSNGYNMTLGGDSPTFTYSIKIKRVDIMTGEEVEFFNSIAEAQRKYHRGIENLIQNDAITQIPKGYTWLKQEENYDKEKIYKKFNIVCQLDLNGKLLNYWLNAEIASENTNTSVGNLRSCLVGQRKKANEFQWCYYKDLPNRINKKYEIKKQTKKVAQYDLEGNLIKIFDSASQAAKETGTNLTKISAVCHGTRKTSNRYKWKYI